MPTPWTPEKRSATKRKIDKEAKRAAERLGAATVAIIAFFPDGEFLHMQDGGTAPMGFKDLYAKMCSAMNILEQSAGEDVPVN